MKLVPLSKASKIVLWDTSNLALRCFFQKGLMGLTRADGYPVGHIHGVVMKLQAFVRDQVREPTALVFALDRFPAWKHALYADYKRRPNRTNFQQFLPDTFTEEFHPVHDVIKLLSYIPCTMVFAEGEESDDVMASFCAKYRDKPIRLVSTDKDMWQLLRMRHVSIGEHDVVTEAAMREEFGLDFSGAKKIALYKAIRGDKSDNIPCIPYLFQKVKAAFYECDGTVKDLIAKMPAGKNKDVLLSHVDQIKMMYKLTKLNRKLDFTENQFEGNSTFLNFFLRKYECVKVLGKSNLFYL